jgi:cation diffusion facilitator CzcD-associated flavoprotein CzcO
MIGGGASASEVAAELDGVTPSSIRAAARRWGARFVEKKLGQDSLVAVMSKRAAHDLTVLAEGRETSEAALIGLIIEILMDDRELYRAVMERARGKAA